MTKEIFLEIIDRVRDGSASDRDIRLYYNWVSKFQSLNKWNEAEMGNSDELKGLLEHRINAQIKTQYPVIVTKRLWTRFVAAASIIFCTSIGGYLLLHKQHLEQTVSYKNDILPGHDQATLTLANGNKIILTKGLSGVLAQQGNTSIGVNGQSAISYIANAKKTSLSVAYNTLSTTVGEQSPYPLILADGTKVWLDAKSSITFPVVFTGKDRIVKITGEAYFEVAHNSAHPFKVAVKNQIVEDIGTRFNINAYDDENVVKTTLVQGSVKVSVPTSSLSALKAGVKLNPGQQSILNSNGLNIDNANIEETVAWKNGYFQFDNENISSVMRKLSRWYNIDVQYSGTISNEKFYATSSRYKNISEVLKMLEKTQGVHFTIEGRRISVIQ